LRNNIADANELEPVRRPAGDVAKIMAFLDALTDPSVRRLNDLVPGSVPSGLPVAD